MLNRNGRVSAHRQSSAVSARIGISILPERPVEDEIVRGTVKTATVTDENFMRNSYIVCNKNKFLTKSARELMETCRKLTDLPSGRD